MPSGLRLLLAVLCLAVPGVTHGQTLPDTTLRSYELAEVVVGGPVEQRTVATVQSVSLARLARHDAATGEGLMRLLPAAHVQTNSRGEALVYLRGAGERQVALFLDGAPLNVPWDARFDLNLLPAWLIGEMRVVKGAPSVQYGVNALAGAIELRTKSLSVPGSLTEVGLRGGWPLGGEGNVLHHRRGSRWFLDAGLGYGGREADALSARSRLPFSQADGRLRVNTDRRAGALLLRSGFRPGSHTHVALTLLHLEGEKGVAPEGHLDPSAVRVRFWRYPTLRNTTLLFSFDHHLGEGEGLRATFWGTRFDQRIDQYADATYREVTATQDEADATFGTRLVATRRVGLANLVLALHGLTSLHRQRDGTPEGAGLLQRYRLHVFSGGVEVNGCAAMGLCGSAGASLDGVATPVTGDKPERPAQMAWGGTAGASYSLSDGHTVKALLGRKVRFATPRELFGTSLDRFLLNPDLQPETAFLAEFGATHATRDFSVEWTFFAHRVFDTIDQVNVTVEGRQLQQRVNLDGSFVMGVEGVASVRAAPHVELHGHATWLRARGYEGAARIPLAEKPELLATVEAVLTAPGRVQLAVQTVGTAGAYGIERAGNARARLPASAVVGVRVSRRFGQRQAFDLFARADNLFDAYVLPQEGLPAPGRSFAAGVRAAW